MKPSIVIITGLSGSGKTVALRALEDNGFFCTDNIPPTLIDSFVSEVSKLSDTRRLAVGVDIREGVFLSSLRSVLKELRGKYDVEVLFLEARSDVLLRRFKETRRPHPLSPVGGGLEDSILKEKELLAPLRESADRIIDTSSYNPHQLRSMVSSLYAGERPPETGLNLSLVSFGFKYGAPQSADLLFDVRFIPNPHFVPELRELTGKDGEVKEYVLDKPVTGEFLERLAGFLGFLIPNYIQEGKTYLTIGIGCTGGRHRSPVIVEELARMLKKQPVKISIAHRDM